MKTFVRALVVLLLLASPAYAASTFTVTIDGGNVIKPFDPVFPRDGGAHTVWVDLRQATTFRFSAEAYNRDAGTGMYRIYTAFRTYNGGPWRSLSANGCGGVDAYTDVTPVTQRDARASGVCPIFAGARSQNVELRIVAVKGPMSDMVYPSLVRSAVVQFFVP